MGDPRKQRSKYRTPGHPWQAKRIIDENRLQKEYGLVNKKEIWKMASLLRNWQMQARHVVALIGDQQQKAAKLLVDSLLARGVLKQGATYEDVLALTIRDVMDRRLQSIVYKMGLSSTSKQARQFILHGKVLVNDGVICAPAHIVKINDKVSLIPGFTPVVVKKAQEELAKSEVIQEKKEKEARKEEKAEKKEERKEENK